MKKIKTYKGFVIAQSTVDPNEYAVFTKDEWSQGEGFRYPEIEAGSVKEAMDFIDSY